MTWLTRRSPQLDARSEILARIQAALDGSPEPEAPVTRSYRTEGEHEPGSDALLEMLVDRLVDYRAVVHRVDDAADLTDVLRRVLSGVESVVVPSWLDSALVSATAAAGVRVLVDGPTVHVSPADLETVGLVITEARVAIAETGTIVLDAAPDQGRRIITLLPDRHLCVVRAREVVQTVPEAIARLAVAPTRPQTWISGPSATSDIELDRVEGVHGPRTLEVLLVDDR